MKEIAKFAVVNQFKRCASRLNYEQSIDEQFNILQEYFHDFKNDYLFIKWYEGQIDAQLNYQYYNSLDIEINKFVSIKIDFRGDKDIYCEVYGRGNQYFYMDGKYVIEFVEEVIDFLEENKDEI